MNSMQRLQQRPHLKMASWELLLLSKYLLRPICVVYVLRDRNSGAFRAPRRGSPSAVCVVCTVMHQDTITLKSTFRIAYRMFS